MRNQVAGYTLLQLLVTTAITAIGINAGLGLSDLLERQGRLVAASNLQRLVAFTRAEAVVRQQDITLCALDAAGACSRDWLDSQIAVFADSNRNRRLDEGEALRLSRWNARRGQVQWRAALGRPYLRFSEMGSTAQNGSFILCAEGAAKLVLRINRGGRPYLADPAGYACR